MFSIKISKIINKSKKKFKNLIKIFKYHKLVSLISFILILIISIVIWTISVINNTVVAGGSTSVAQLMENITKQYKRDNKEDIIYNSSGSIAALVGIKNNSYEFGFLSKNLDLTPKSENNNINVQQLWINNNIISFVCARDYIMIIYNLPYYCKINSQQSSLYFQNFYDGEGTKLIQKIYTNPNFTWQQAFGSQLICDYNNDKFYTLTRESGSGTRDFFESSIIKLKNYKINQITSSNGSMYQAISTTPGSIGYISFSYIKSIIANKNLGIKSIASIIESPGSKPKSPYKIINNNYKFNPDYYLTRPFIGIINYKNKKFNKSLAFIAWMLDPLPYSKTKLKLHNGKNNPYYDPCFQLNSHYAAYWYIKEGQEPLSFDDIFFQKYNNNTNFTKNNKLIKNEKISLNFKKNYKSIWDIIIEKFPEKYKKYPGFEYSGEKK